MADPQIKALARRLAALEKARLRAKQPNLGFSTIDGGALQAIDDNDALTMVMGLQFDGTNAASVITGPTPPTPTAPVVTSQLGSLRVYWDGTFTGGAVAPMDFARVLVYAKPTSTYAAPEPLNQTLIVGQMTSATGGEITAALNPNIQYTVYLVCWTLAGKYGTASAVALGTPTNSPVGGDGLVPVGAVTLTGRQGLLSVDLSWGAHSNPDPVEYEIFMATAPTVPTGLASELLTKTAGTRWHVTTLPDTTRLVGGTNYNFKVRTRDADGPSATLSNLVTVTPKLAANDEISADYAYLGEVSFDQMTGGKVNADFLLGASIRTAESGPRVEMSPGGVNVFSSSGPRITLPTDLTQKATFEGSATMDGLTVEDGLEIRGDSNRFTIGSKVTLETKTQGSATPPSVIVDHEKVNFALSPYLFAISGIHMDEALVPRMRTMTFFGDAEIRTNDDRYWKPPTVGVEGGFSRAEMVFNGGLADVWDAGASEYRYVVMGNRYSSNGDGTANFDGTFMRKYDTTDLATSGAVAPTQIGADVAHAHLNPFLSPVIGRNITDRTKYVTAEMSTDTGSVTLRKWSAAMAIESTVTTPTFADTATYFRACQGVIAGRAVDMMFHPTDTTEVFVVALREDAYSGPALQRKAYVFRASDGARLPNYDFDMEGVDGPLFASHATSSGGFANFYSGTSDPWTKYSNLTWTTESSTWHAAYGWRADAGWKTNASVVNTFTMKKRHRLTVTSPALPPPAAGAGTPVLTNDVEGINVYLSRATTARTDLFLQTPVPLDGVTTQSFSTIPAFTGTNPPASSDFPDQASARFESSASTNGVPKFQLTGDGFAHFEELDITGTGSTAFTGKAFEQLYYSIRAQAQTMGGGIKAVDASYNISWSQRFIIITLGNSNNTFHSGEHDIINPQGYTVTNKALTSNVADLTIVGHKFRKGDTIQVGGVGAPFDGAWIVSKVTTDHVFYDCVNADIASTASGGSVQTRIVGYGGAATANTTTGKVPMASWTALWYELPYSWGSGGVAGENGVVAVTNKALTSNVATLTISAGHEFAVGDSMVVNIGDAVFDGEVIITGLPTDTTVTYAKTNANVASVATTGTASPSGKSTRFGNFRYTTYTSDFVVPNNWILLAVRNSDQAAVMWATGNVVEPGFDSDSPVLKQVILDSTTDVTTSAGNKPALRVGNIAGTHLRIDGDEIQRMSNDTTPALLLLNGGGGGVRLGMGDPITAFAMGSGSGNTDASSQVVFNHGLGKTPLSVTVTGRNSLQYQVFSIGPTQVTLTCRTSAGALTGSGVATNFFFQAAA